MTSIPMLEDFHFPGKECQASEQEARRIFEKAKRGEALTSDEILKFNGRIRK